MVGLALSQVGEFSFILAKIAFNKNLLPNSYYQLFLAVAVITMALAPFLMNVSRPLATRLLRLPLPDFLVKGLFPLKEVQIPELKNHLVIIGKDASALKLSLMAKYYEIPHVSIIFDPGIAREKMGRGDLVVYGDAVNEPILLKAHSETADVVVVSVGKTIPSMAIIYKVRELNKKAHILARARSTADVADLYEVGADQVLPEKLEIAINLFNRILLKKLYPRNEINRMLMRIRTLNLGAFTEKDVINRPTIWDEFSNIDISAVTVEKNSEAEGKSIYQINLRKKSGVTLLAIRRGDQVIEHPEPDIILIANDIAYLMGNPEQINFAAELFLSNSSEENKTE
ncbi:MAG: NAD-binding protein [Bacteroidales bacterium]|nr:NAD-binding protein [Bacteroidales bacterium]